MMKYYISRTAYLILAMVMSLSLLGGVSAYADDAEVESEETGETTEEVSDEATSVSISPVSKVLELEPSSTYDDFFKITNNGKSDLRFETYASPYSYTYSEEEQEYKLGFSKENNYTQIARWVTFRSPEGNYAEKANFTAKGGETVEIHYRITTPASIPAGGQYAVLFAHTFSDAPDASGIKTEASPGLVVYGRAKGETITNAEINDMAINETQKVGNDTLNIINGSAKIRNSGNVDFMAYGTLRVTGIFGRVYYETTMDQGKISVIPDSELVLSDSWEDTPYFGLFNTSWTVYAADGEPQTITRTILIMPAPVIILMILLLTIVIIWIIILVRKRKERRSRFMV